MIPDMLVGDILLEALLYQSCKSPDCGVLVDGFPRTAVQVRVCLRACSKVKVCVGSIEVPECLTDEHVCSTPHPNVGHPGGLNS